MAGMFTDYWRVVKPAPSKSNYISSDPEGSKFYSNFSWYTKVMKGSNTRFSKYAQYKNMDGDVFVARALDTIAEEMTSPNVKTNLNFEIVYQNENNVEVPDSITMTVRAALRRWSEMQDFNTVIFDIARETIKYGDCYFRKTSDFRRWQYIRPEDVIGVTPDDKGKVIHYHIRTGEKNKAGAFGDVVILPAEGIVHFSLSSMMGDNGPFGESVLFPTIKAFRHLSLLEDSVIIYRIVRAPERRVFFIDVGNMPPPRVTAYLQAIKNEMKQKRIPSETGGTDKVDSVYNPMSMNEDYFFAQTAEGRGSRVETLPGGENLGEITDLNYFQNKFLQGLRIPASYMRGAAEGGSLVTDGKVGIAYIEELRFANYVSRLQSKLNDTFDYHFKAYMKSAGIKIDSQLFKLKLVDPQNFRDYREAEVNEKLLSNYNQVKDDKTISARFKHQHYLGWNEDTEQENHVLRMQEEGVPKGGIKDNAGVQLTEIRMLYDMMWIENRPTPKVSDDWDNHEEATKPLEEETEKPADDDADDADSKGSAKGGDDDDGDKGEKGGLSADSKDDSDKSDSDSGGDSGDKGSESSSPAPAPAPSGE